MKVIVDAILQAFSCLENAPSPLPAGLDVKPCLKTVLLLLLILDFILAANVLPGL